MKKSIHNILNICSSYQAALVSFRNLSIGCATAKLFWNPNGEGAESVEELNEEPNIGDGGFGISSLPIR